MKSETERVQLETLTARDSAAKLGVCYATVLRLLKRGKLKCLPLRHKRIHKAELERFLREESQ